MILMNKKRYELMVEKINVILTAFEPTEYVFTAYPIFAEKMPLKKGIDEKFTKSINKCIENGNNPRFYIEWEEEDEIQKTHKFGEKYIPTIHCKKCHSIKVLELPLDDSKYKCHDCEYIGNNKKREKK